LEAGRCADPTNWKIFVDAHRNLTLNVGDTDPEQLSLLAKTYVDGLVGQVPYQMGTESIRLLQELASGKPVPQDVLTTSLVEVVTNSYFATSSRCEREPD
jgi:ABC-type sugar transport system substrate-binding protein